MISPLPSSNNHAVALASANISPAIHSDHDSDSDRVINPDEQRDYADQSPPSDSDLDGDTQILATLWETHSRVHRCSWHWAAAARHSSTAARGDSCKDYVLVVIPARTMNQMFCAMMMMCISQRGLSIRSAESTRLCAGCRPNWQRGSVKTLGSCVYPPSKASNGLWGSWMPP